MIGGSVGGPLVSALDLTIPTPVLSLGAAHGVRDDLELTLGADVTAALYGNLHVEPGLAWHPLVRDRGPAPTVSLLGSVHVITNARDALVAPRASGIAAWRVGSGHSLYAGVDAAVVIGAPSRILAGPLLGGELGLGRTGIQLELKWLAPYYDVDPAAPAWLSPGGRGYLSVLLGFSHNLGSAP